MHLPLVLVPGLGCTGKLFAPQWEELSRLGPLQLLDHRQDASLAAIAKRFLHIAPERFCLAGLSMGGYIAFEIMRCAPERVARLALLATNAISDSPERIEMRKELRRRSAEGAFFDIAEELYPNYVHEARHEDFALRDIYIDMMRETGPAAFQRQLQVIAARPDSRPILGQISVPTTVIVGAEDMATPVEQAKIIAEGIKGAHLEIVRDCGHLSTLEKPKTIARLLTGWWQANA